MPLMGEIVQWTDLCHSPLTAAGSEEGVYCAGQSQPVYESGRGGEGRAMRKWMGGRAWWGGGDQEAWLGPQQVYLIQS